MTSANGGHFKGLKLHSCTFPGQRTPKWHETIFIVSGACMPVHVCMHAICTCMYTCIYGCMHAQTMIRCGAYPVIVNNKSLVASLVFWVVGIESYDDVMKLLSRLPG